LGIEPLNLME